jgi:hypothetical protein
MWNKRYLNEVHQAVLSLQDLDILAWCETFALYRGYTVHSTILAIRWVCWIFLPS